MAGEDESEMNVEGSVMANPINSFMLSITYMLGTSNLISLSSHILLAMGDDDDDEGVVKTKNVLDDGKLFRFFTATRLCSKQFLARRLVYAFFGRPGQLQIT